MYLLKSKGLHPHYSKNPPKQTPLCRTLHLCLLSLSKKHHWKLILQGLLCAVGGGAEIPLYCQVFASIPGKEVFRCFDKRGQESAHCGGGSVLCGSESRFGRALFELTLHMFGRGEVFGGGGGATPARSCEEGWVEGANVSGEQQLRWRAAALR